MQPLKWFSGKLFGIKAPAVKISPKRKERLLRRIRDWQKKAGIKQLRKKRDEHFAQAWEHSMNSKANLAALLEHPQTRMREWEKFLEYGRQARKSRMRANELEQQILEQTKARMGAVRKKYK